MRLRLKNPFGHMYQPLNEVTIDALRIRRNYEYLSRVNKNIQIAPVLKSNAYGHGLNIIAKQFDALNPPFLCVDSLYEAYELLKSKIHTKILIMGYINPISLKTKKLPFSFTVYNHELLEAIIKYQPHANIHIFVDTGMHREGFAIEKLPEFLIYIKKAGINVEGVMSHLAMSDKPNNKLTQRQIELFLKSQLILKKYGIYPRWNHILNSSGLLNHKYFTNKNLGNVARIGLASYGIDPEGNNKKLKPILQLKSHIAQVKELKKGDGVGYDFTYVANKNMRVGILPIGYFDGVDRRLSNKGFVSINSRFCPIIGKVSMNITTIDISNHPSINVGEEVIIYSNISSDKNSIENAARLCNTIPYDLLIHIDPSIKRFTH